MYPYLDHCDGCHPHFYWLIRGGRIRLTPLWRLENRRPKGYAGSSPVPSAITFRLSHSRVPLTLRGGVVLFEWATVLLKSAGWVKIRDHAFVVVNSGHGRSGCHLSGELARSRRSHLALPQR